MLSTQLFQYATSRAMCIDKVTCSMTVVGMGIITLADDCSIPTLLDKVD